MAGATKIFNIDTTPKCIFGTRIMDLFKLINQYGKTASSETY